MIITKLNFPSEPVYIDVYYKCPTYKIKPWHYHCVDNLMVVEYDKRQLSLKRHDVFHYRFKTDDRLVDVANMKQLVHEMFLDLAKIETT